MKTHNVLSSLVISAMSVLVPAGGADASSEVVLHNFPANVFPYGQLLLEKSGTLYGTTMAGGVQNLGTVYEMKPTRNGWKEKEIYSFNGGDASYPSAGAINGTNSQTLYGVTTGGPNGEAGTVFSLVRDGAAWTQTTLYGFDGSGSDGQQPQAALLLDQKTATLYGTTAQGGNFGCGTVFQIDGAGTYSILFSFDSYSQGCVPTTQLQRWSSAHSVIGTTSMGGDANAGNVFLLFEKQGKWKESVLHALDGSDEGLDPVDLTARSSNGAVYGVTEYGGANGAGVIFEVGADLQYHVVYTFTGAGDGKRPVGLYLDPGSGNLYGATYLGGTNGMGTVFQLAFDGANWVQTVLYNFRGGKDGANPASRPTLDVTDGRLYGTTAGGGKYGGGTVYEITL